MNEKLSFRNACREDIPLILQFIRDLAAYERMEDQVVATPQLLEQWLFDRQKAFALLQEILRAGEGSRTSSFYEALEESARLLGSGSE